MTLASMIDYTKFVCQACNNEDPECQQCCDHSDTDGHCCLICGKDCTEALAGMAEYALEGDR